jgi:hypothetical protein
VITPEELPGGLDPQKLSDTLGVVREQVATALWLSAGMICAISAIAAMALGWRRFALLWGFLYSLSLCFVHNGHAQILGPVGCAIAFTGLVWPGKKAEGPR